MGSSFWGGVMYKLEYVLKAKSYSKKSTKELKLRNFINRIIGKNKNQLIVWFIYKDNFLIDCSENKDCDF